MISMVELSKKNQSSFRRGSTTDKLIFSAYRKDGHINYVVFYFGTNVLEKMGIGPGDKLNAYMAEDSYQIDFEVDPHNGKTINIAKATGRGALAIKYCKGLPYPTDKGVEMKIHKLEGGFCSAEMPEEGVSYE